jgi:serine/threonine protein kinase
MPGGGGPQRELARISSVKITDFGLSAITARSMKEPLGTRHYAAPEIQQGRPYDRAVDIWSLGVLSFVVLAGLLPFAGDTDRAVKKAVVECQYSFTGPRWEKISHHARSFICSLLKIKASDRPTAGAALSHSWFQGRSEDDV